MPIKLLRQTFTNSNYHDRIYIHITEKKKDLSVIFSYYLMKLKYFCVNFLYTVSDKRFID